MEKKWPLPSAKIYPTWYGWPGFLWQYLLLYRPLVDNTVDTKLGPLNAQRICNWLLVMAQPKSSLIIEGSAWLAFPRHVVLLRWLTSLTVTLRSQSEKPSSRRMWVYSLSQWDLQMYILRFRKVKYIVHNCPIKASCIFECTQDCPAVCFNWNRNMWEQPLSSWSPSYRRDKVLTGPKVLAVMHC